MEQVNIIEALRAHITQKYGSQAAAARAWGVSDAYVSMVMRGKHGPSAGMLEDAGYERLPYSPQYAKVAK